MGAQVTYSQDVYGLRWIVWVSVENTWQYSWQNESVPWRAHAVDQPTTWDLSLGVYIMNSRIRHKSFSNLQENVEDGEESAMAIEVRPRSRLFKSFPVPPAKWTVAVFRLVLGPISQNTVYIIFESLCLKTNQFICSLKPPRVTSTPNTFYNGHVIYSSCIELKGGKGTGLLT